MKGVWEAIEGCGCSQAHVAHTHTVPVMTEAYSLVLATVYAHSLGPNRKISYRWLQKGYTPQRGTTRMAASAIR